MRGRLALRLTLLLLLAGLGHSAAGEKRREEGRMPGGAFNLRIVSDSVPDWSSRENFVRSALSGWKTDEEKALAQFRWMHRSRRVGQFAPEDSRPVLDPVLFFNSYGITYCSMISAMNCSLWEAWGRRGRCVNLPGHVVSEVFYDHAWHMFDNDFCNYFINEKGTVASAAELGGSRIHGNVADLKPGEYYVFDHCPTASSPRGRIFMGPSSHSLIRVARNWYPGPGKIHPRFESSGAQAGHRYVLGLRPNERYTRHWRPLGTGKLYARPFRNGKDPAADGSTLRNSRCNGEWVWTPDLSDPAVLFAGENVECSKKGLRAKDQTKPAFAIFRVAAANVVTSASFSARTSGKQAKLLVSGNGGLSWESVGPNPKGVAGEGGTVTEAVAGRLEYLFKIELARGSVLEGLKLTTITQVNPRALPALRLGRNEIVAVSDGPLESIAFNPRLAGGKHLKETFKARGWQSIERPGEFDPSVRAAGKAEMVLRAVAPRDIRRVRMACTAYMVEPAADLKLAVKAGRRWQLLRKEEFGGAPYDRRISAESMKLPAGTREVLLRYALDFGVSGLVNLSAEVNYEPSGPFMPYDVVYSWSEWRGGKWIERRHTERVKNTYHRYALNVGGERPPRMNWLRIKPAGRGRTGHSDGQDVGNRAARPAYRLAYGKNLSIGRKYRVNRPASAAFADMGNRLLTDGHIFEASVWKLRNVNPVGPRNKQRAGELVVWAPSGEVAVTLDLGRTKTVGGARICAVQPNQNVLFPAKMVVELSSDGKKFALAGGTGWEDCFFPPGDQMIWEGADSPVYDRLPAGGILSYQFPIVFKRTRKARYVRFRMTPSKRGSKPAAIGLWELEVFEKLVKLPWDERLRLPEAPSREEQTKEARK